MGVAGLAKGGTKFLTEGLERISQCADSAVSRYKPDDPGSIASSLADGLKATRTLLQQVRASQLEEPGKSDVAFELQVKRKAVSKGRLRLR